MLNLQAIEKQAVGQVWSVGHHWLISDLELRPQILNLHLLFLHQENSSFHLPSVVGLTSHSMKPSCSPDQARTLFTPAIFSVASLRLPYRVIHHILKTD